MKRTLVVVLLMLLLAAGCRSDPTLTPAAPTPLPAGLSETYEVRGAIRTTQGGQEAAPADALVGYRVLREGAEVLGGQGLVAEDGSFVLGVHLAGTDVLELEAYAPGYEASGARLSASEVAAGAEPRIELRPQLSEMLQIAGVDWRPESVPEGIDEPAQAELGGMLSVFVRNGGSLPIALDDVTLNGASLMGHAGSDQVRWSRLRPDPIPAGGMALFQANLAAVPEEVTIAFYPADARPVSATVVLEPSPLRITYVTWSAEGDRLLVYVSNRADAALIELQGLSIDGVEVEARLLQSELAPGETGLVVAEPGFGPAALDYLSCQVVGSVRGGGEVTAWAQAKPLAPTFPMAIWADLNELEPEVIADIREHGVDTLVLELPDTPSDPRWQALRFEHELSFIAVPRFPASGAQLDGYAKDERILAWLLSDTQSRRPSLSLYEMSERVASAPRAWRFESVYAGLEAEYHRFSTLPTLVSLPAIARSGVLGQAADLVSPEHFVVDSPGANYWGMHGIAEVFSYTLSMRDQVAPRPVWPWAQALCSTSWYRDTSACWNRLPTPSEMRTQVYAQVAAGAKGLLWHSHRIPYVAEGPEQWAEVGELNRLLGAVGDILAAGDVADTARVLCGEALARAIVSERAVVVPIVNMAYLIEERTWLPGEDPPPPSPATVFAEQEGLELELLLPEWIDPASVLALAPEGVARLEWTSEARLITIELPMLQDVVMVLVAEDASTVDEIAQALER